jgi:PAS domain S-box-containing protein
LKRRTLIFIMIIFSAICVLLFNLSYTAARNIAVSKLNDEQMIHARQAANGIEEYFRTWTGILSSFAKKDDIIRTTAEGRHDLRLLCESHQEQIGSITRLDENGVMLYTYPDSSVIGSDISGQPHITTILKERKPIVSDVFKTVQGFDAVALHVPVFRGDVFKGTIAIVINFEILAKRYLDVIRIGETGHAWVVSRDGTQIYSPIPGFAGKSVYDNYRDNPSVLLMVKDMLRGHEGSAVYTSDRIRDRIVGPARIYAVYMPVRFGNTFWSVAVNSSEQEVLSGLTSFRNSLVLIMCVIFVGGVLLSVVGAKAWLIVKEENKRKKIEASLIEGERRYRDLFERNPAPMLIYQRGTLKMLAVNDAFVYHYGYSGEQALALSLTDLYPDDEKRPISDLASKLKGHAYAGEWHHVKADGSIINIVARSHDIDYWGNDARIAVITDITDLKKTEAELEKHRLHLEEMVRDRTAELILSQTRLTKLLEDVSEANKELAEAKERTEAANNKLKDLDRLKSMFIAAMSHELRTPLNSIIGFTGIILQGMTGEINNEQRDQLQRVLKAGRHLLALITDVIDISKIEAGKIEAYVEEFELDSLINDAVSDLKLQIKEKGLEIEVRAAPIKLRTDRKRLFQCVLNYLSNAVKYSEKGKILLSAEGKDDRLELEVTDTGMGMKEEDLPKLFNSFVRLDSDMKKTVAGTGLGLYLTKKLVTEVLGGEVSVASTYGKGSTFSLSIPMHLKKMTVDGGLAK